MHVCIFNRRFGFMYCSLWFVFVFLIVMVLVLCISLRFVVHVCIFNRHTVLVLCISVRFVVHVCIFNRHVFGFVNRQNILMLACLRWLHVNFALLFHSVLSVVTTCDSFLSSAQFHPSV